MTKAEKRLSDDFASNKGRLPYPVSGRHTIVAAFGEQQHQELKYVRTNNSGIDIQTAPGTDARAVFNGEVTRVFVVPGYNNSVIVRHGNYLTVYSNLSQVYVKAGDKVSTRQAIGKIFTDTDKEHVCQYKYSYDMFIYSHYSVNSLILFIAYHSSTTHRNETPKPGTAESAPGKFESSICHTFLNE